MISIVHNLKNKLSKTRFLVSATLLTSLFIFNSAFAKTLDRVVAVYDQNQPVLLSQLKGKITTHSSEREIKDAVDNYVFMQLRNDSLKSNNVYSTTAEINQQIAYMAQQSGVTVEELLKGVQLQGISISHYRDYIAKQITNQKILGFAYQQNFGLVDHEKVSAEAKVLYENDVKNNKVKQVKVYNISHILMQSNPIKTDAQVKSQLTLLRSQIQSKKITFAEAAKANSVDLVSAANGGELGEQPLDIYDPIFASVASRSKIGVISQIFKTQFGWHILRVNSIGTRAITEEEYKHIAFEKLNTSNPDKIIENWKAGLLRNANIVYYYK